jgi:NADH:ubiquinone reductase (H+-translocating)
MEEAVDHQVDNGKMRADPRPETSALHAHESSGEEALHRIVVVGGGAAGLELVTRLGDRLGRRSRASVTLVECARTHLWKPLLHAVAAGSIDPGEYEVNYLAQAHWHGFRYRLGEMIGLDRAEREVHLAATFDKDGRQITPARSIGYDTLVIAIGSVTNDFGTPGVAEHAVPLETPTQAERFNRRLVNACLRAQQGPVRPGQLHVAIVGAGATGTELAAELHRTIREVIAYGLDRIDPQRDVRIVLIEAGARILPGLPERISRRRTACSTRSASRSAPAPG